MPEKDDLDEIKGSPDAKESEKTYGKKTADSGRVSAFSPLKRFFRKGSAPNLILILTVITVFISAALGFVYSVTSPIIAEFEKETSDKAMRQVVTAADFTPAAFDDDVFVGRSADGEIAGYAVKVAAAGYGGAISMIVGVGTDGVVTGVVIVSMSETPGIGSKITTESWFIDQFVGKGGQVELGKGVDAITGASVSSRAVAAGVREAVSRVIAVRNGN